MTWPWPGIYQRKCMIKKGSAYLVGAGPGDPGLLTIKGKECLNRADVVIYDYLANQSFLEYAPPGAEIIFVGKKGGCHTMGQDDINKLLVEKTRQGNIVVRLKGGDPCMFGRGGEEAQALVRAGLLFEIVPGVTSAIAVSAYAGIPLTHRDYTSSVTFITGHESPGKTASNLAWDKISTGSGTLVFLMGMGKLPSIAENLIKNGRSPETPVAVIHRGTVSQQKTVTGTLENIAKKASDANMKPPAIIVVGHVVTLKDELDWFESKPLFGKKLVITRAREQASDFVQVLYMLGADCIEFPTIEVVPPDSWDALDASIQKLQEYNWLLFTSVNSVKFFLERLEAGGKDVRDLKDLKVAAIGPKTADTWKQFGIRVDLVPDEYRAEAIVECFKTLGPVNGLKILMPRALKAREILPETLRKMGAEIDIVTTYQTVRPDHVTDQVRDMLKNSAVDMVTFTSSSTVENFTSMFADQEDALKQWMGQTAVACIGPVTAKTAEDKGYTVAVMPAEYTIEAFTDAIVAFFAENSSPCIRPDTNCSEFTEPG